MKKVVSIIIIAVCVLISRFVVNYVSSQNEKEVFINNLKNSFHEEEVTEGTIEAQAILTLKEDDIKKIAEAGRDAINEEIGFDAFEVVKWEYSYVVQPKAEYKDDYPVTMYYDSKRMTIFVNNELYMQVTYEIF